MQVEASLAGFASLIVFTEAVEKFVLQPAELHSSYHPISPFIVHSDQAFLSYLQKVVQRGSKFYEFLKHATFSGILLIFLNEIGEMEVFEIGKLWSGPFRNRLFVF